MNVSLTQELEDFVDQKVQSGWYRSSSEVVREALRTLRAQDHQQAEKLKALRREIRAGIRSLDQGKGVEGSSALRCLKELM